MIFSSPLFFVFYILVFFIYWYGIPLFFNETSRKSAKHIFLLVVSYIFYMTWDWRFGSLILISTIIDYFAGLLLEKFLNRDSRIKTLILITSISVNLGILGFFKYADFFIDSFIQTVNSLAPETFSPSERDSLLLNVLLPLGISFFTFQSMSYTIDVYRRVIPTEKNFFRFALFVSFFPQLVAGPIVVAKDFLPQLNEEPAFDNRRMLEAARWFMLGFLKKSAIADNMSVVVDQIYAYPEFYGMTVHWLGAAAFCVQIYCDFSGYTDMAWGAALGLGYRLPVNFNMPYKSTTITGFWQRWHISLIKWIRDYLYIPLGGNRVSNFRHKFNIFITMFLAGLWHGANWTFVFWGATQGAVMVIENIISAVTKNRKTSELKSDSEWIGESFAKNNRLLKLCIVLLNQFLIKMKVYRTQIASIPGFAPGFRYSKNLLFFSYTIFLTMISATIFRASNIEDFFLIFTRMFALDDFPNSIPPVSMYRTVFWGILALVIGHILGHFIFEKKKFQWNVHPAFEIAAAPILILILTQISASDVEAFVYFVF